MLQHLPPDKLRELLDRIRAGVRRFYEDVDRRLIALEVQLGLKAGFDPNQPRHPAGTSTGGQWREAGGGDGNADSSNHGNGANGTPTTERERWLQLVAINVEKVTSELGRRLRGAVVITAEVVRALMDELEYPRTLDELRMSPEYMEFDSPKAFEKYFENKIRVWQDCHHIVGQTDGNLARFPGRIHTTENIVCIPFWKHWGITGYYNRRPRDLNGLSVRESIEELDFGRQYRRGLNILRDHGVLK
ncbi:MAG: hypothetical protein ACT4P2_05335 [Pseudomonadota bacterium]